MPKTRIRCADSVVRGYYVYMDKWDPVIGVKFNAVIEVSNRHDRYDAVAVIFNRGIVARHTTPSRARKSGWLLASG